jgi:hypothetical protein
VKLFAESVRRIGLGFPALLEHGPRRGGG